MNTFRQATRLEGSRQTVEKTSHKAGPAIPDPFWDMLERGAGRPEDYIQRGERARRTWRRGWGRGWRLRQKWLMRTG